MTPKGSQVEINGLHYKVGRLGFAFYYNNGGWQKSAKSADDIYDAIERMEAE